MNVLVKNRVAVWALNRLDEFFWRHGGKAGVARKYNWQYWVDQFQYRNTRRIAKFFHMFHCEECRDGLNVD